jgi:hypothetical protein
LASRCAQETHGAGVFDLQPREQAGERVAALNALFAPVGFVRDRRNRRLGEGDFLDDAGQLDFFSYGVGRDPESGDDPDERKDGGEHSTAQGTAARKRKQLLKYNGRRLPHDFPTYFAF